MSPVRNPTALTAALLLTCASTALARPEFISLEPPPGATSTRVFATDGMQHVGIAMFGEYPENRPHACLWTGTPPTFVDLKPAGARSSCAYGVDAGRQVGTAEMVVPPPGGGVGGNAALWNGTAESFVSLASGTWASAYSISGDIVVGSKVLYHPTYPLFSAQMWRVSTREQSSFGVGEAYAIADRRAAGYSSRFVGAGTYIDEATMWFVDTPGGSLLLDNEFGNSCVRAVFGGVAVGFAETAFNYPFRAAMFHLADGSLTWLGPTGSVATGASANKQVGYSNAYSTSYHTIYQYDAERRACMWRGSESSYVDLRSWLMRRGLNLSGWVLNEATGVSPDGTMIVGNGTHNGVIKGWIILRIDDNTPNPGEPCPADLHNGIFAPPGQPDGAVTIDDLVYFLGLYNAGRLAVDLDDGSGFGYPDNAVNIDDLLYFLRHFEQGC